MKKTAIALLMLLAGFATKAQDFQGQAVYESHTDIDDAKIDRPEITPEMKKMIAEQLKKAFEKTYILNFNRTESTYEEEQKLDAPGGENPMFKMMASFMGSAGEHYKNIKDKTLVVHREFFGKDFLVSDTLTHIKWKLESDTKKIGDYTCYKATADVPTNKSDFRNFRPKKEDEKEDEAKKEDGQKNTNFMDQVEMPKTIKITAWYTPDIPVSQGPEEYWGLPGLILEVTDGKTSLLCTKVVLNPKEKAEIKAPDKGKKVTQAEYSEIVVKKVEEMREMYGGPGGPGGRRGMGMPMH